MTISRVTRALSNTIEKKELDYIYKKTVNAALSKIQAEFLQTRGFFEDKLDLLASSVLYTKVDGKSMLNPVGASGEKIEMAIFTSFAPSKNVRSLVSLSKKCGIKISEIGYDGYFLCELLEKSELEHVNYIVIHMGSDFTSVHVVFGGGMILNKTLPLGRDGFVSEINQELGISYESANNMLKNYCLGNLSESENLIIRSAIQEILKIWLSGVTLLFTEFTGIKTFASKIYLTGEGFDVPDIYEFLVEEPWTKSIAFREPPEFKKLSAADFANISDMTGKASGVDWMMPISSVVVSLKDEK